MPENKEVPAPWLAAIVAPAARRQVEYLLGFWVLWHYYGGREGLEAAPDGLMPGRTLRRRLVQFQKVFGCTVDEFGGDAGPELAAWFIQQRDERG